MPSLNNLLSKKADTSSKFNVGQVSITTIFNTVLSPLAMRPMGGNSSTPRLAQTDLRPTTSTVTDCPLIEYSDSSKRYAKLGGKADGRYMTSKTPESRNCLCNILVMVVRFEVFRARSAASEMYLPWCSAVWRGVSAAVFRGLAWCICGGVPRSGVMYLPWCFAV